MFQTIPYKEYLIYRRKVQDLFCIVWGNRNAQFSFGDLLANLFLYHVNQELIHIQNLLSNSEIYSWLKFKFQTEKEPYSLLYMHVE